MRKGTIVKNDIIRQALEGKRLAFGTHCSYTDIGMYEICGKLGYDYIWIDNEHAGMTFPMINNGIVGAKAAGCASVVRVGGHEIDNIKPVLEMGPDAIVVPMVNSAEEAQHVIDLCLYPPRGIRGFGPLRAIDYAQMPMDQYYAEADKLTARLLQCEHYKSVECLDEIMEVDGVDGIICGPVDLSASVGKLGKLDDPEVVDLMNTIIRKCKAKKMPFGISIGYNMKLIEHWIGEGATLVSMGTMYDYFAMMSNKVIKKVRNGDFTD